MNSRSLGFIAALILSAKASKLTTTMPQRPAIHQNELSQASRGVYDRSSSPSARTGNFAQLGQDSAIVPSNTEEIAQCVTTVNGIFTDKALEDPSSTVVSFVQNWCVPNIQFLNRK